MGGKKVGAKSKTWELGVFVLRIFIGQVKYGPLYSVGIGVSLLL